MVRGHPSRPRDAPWHAWHAQGHVVISPLIILALICARAPRRHVHPHHLSISLSLRPADTSTGPASITLHPELAKKLRVLICECLVCSYVGVLRSGIPQRFTLAHLTLKTLIQLLISTFDVEDADSYYT